MNTLVFERKLRDVFLETDDVAMQIDFAFEILAAIRGITVEELYQTVDCHMTDSTKHNKGIADVLKDLYNLDKKAGKIFCGTHTALGFHNTQPIFI